MAVNALHMGALIRQWLYPEATDATVECQIERIRYRPASRCTIQYELKITRPNEAPRQAMVAALLNCDPRKTQRLKEQMQQHSARIADESPQLLPLYHEIPQAGLLLQRFPFDARLPETWSANHVLDEAFDTWYLSQIGAKMWEVQNRKLEPVRWRAGLSAVQRYRLDLVQRDSGERLRQEFFVKNRKPEIDTKEGSDYLDLWLNTLNGKLAFRVPELWFRYPDAQLTVYEPINSPSLQHLLQVGSACGDQARLIAEGIASLHNSDLVPGRVLYAVDFVARYTRSALALATIMTEHAAQLRRIVNALHRLVVETLTVPVHGDFKPDHILIGEQGLALLDMDPLVRADPMADLARLTTRLFHADLLYQAPPALGEGIARELLGTYGRNAPFQRYETYPGHFAGELLNLAEHLFQHQAKGWRSKCGQLINEAELAVAGRLELPRVLLRRYTVKAASVPDQLSVNAKLSTTTGQP